MRIGTKAAVAAMLLLAGGVALADVGAYHVDEQCGYKVRTPKGWTPVPIKNTERWIVAKYLSKREYGGTDETGATVLFKPEMRVIIFPKSVTNDRGVKLTKGEGEEGAGVTLRIKNPYRNYTDYLKRNYAGGGWFESLRKERKRKDLEWTLVEIKVEKLTWGGKKRLVAGIFHQEDGDFVVQFEILETTYKKLKMDVYGCLNSFRFIPRKGSLGRTTTEGAKGPVDEEKLTPAERKKLRKEKQERAFRHSVEKLPAGWDSFTYKDFFVLHDTDRKYAKKIVARAEAVRAWLDKSFPYLGDEYVRPMIIRVCKSSDEAASYVDTSQDAWFDAESEIVTYEDKSAGARSWSFESVVRGVIRAWFYDKNADLYIAIPAWVEYGLLQYLGTATLKGSKLSFKPDDWEKERLREAEKAGELKRIEEMAKLSWNTYKGEYQAQSAQLFRYLFNGPGRGLKGAKTFLKDYLLTLANFIEEKEKERKAKEKEGAEDKPKTEEEEAEAFRKRREAWRRQEQELLDEVFRRAFKSWKKSTWESMERSFRKYMG